MPERRRIGHIDALEEQLVSEAKRLRKEAEKLRPGAERERLLRRARQAETGSQMREWLHTQACSRQADAGLLRYIIGDDRHVQNRV